MSEPVNLATAVEFQNEIARLHGEIDRLRLTDAERTAVLFAARRLEISYVEERTVAATLRGLLERTK